MSKTGDETSIEWPTDDKPRDRSSDAGNVTDLRFTAVDSKCEFGDRLSVVCKLVGFLVASKLENCLSLSGLSGCLLSVRRAAKTVKEKH